jgi:hypothetical protein
LLSVSSKVDRQHFFAEREKLRLYTLKLVTILACTNLVGRFIPPIAKFRGKIYRWELADGFQSGSSVSVTDSGLISQGEPGYVMWLVHVSCCQLITLSIGISDC